MPPALTVESIIARIANVMNLIIPFLMIVATVVFLWGVARYISSNSDDELARARRTIISGIVFLAIMASVWGFVYLLITFVFDSRNPAPTIPGVNIVDRI